MRRSFAILGGALGILGLAGCAANPTSPVEIGDHSYYLGAANMGGAFGNVQAVNQNLMVQAAAFCHAQGLKLQVNADNIDAPHFGDPGNASIQFACVEHPAPVTLRPDRGVATITH
ncbi:MAG: hypothetical protein M0Z99_01980 [Betaproteobacteria bacterium]|nr:hypothetical protein [Betaproteobacteria bacterium]